MVTISVVTFGGAFFSAMLTTVSAVVWTARTRSVLSSLCTLANNTTLCLVQIAKYYNSDITHMHTHCKMSKIKCKPSVTSHVHTQCFTYTQQLTTRTSFVYLITKIH